jgi:hypothetical protein
MASKPKKENVATVRDSNPGESLRYVCGIHDCHMSGSSYSREELIEHTLLWHNEANSPPSSSTTNTSLKPPKQAVQQPSDSVRRPPPSFGALSPSKEEHTRQFRDYMVNGVLRGDAEYRTKWRSFGKNHRENHSHAALIEGPFGVDAVPPCQKCVTRKLNCRKYRPGYSQIMRCGACTRRGDKCE